jgi:hypothetical protein
VIRILLLPLLAVVPFIAGCGGSELGCVPVSGKVTFTDGTKFETYQIRNIELEPTDVTKGARKASGSINPDGTFVLMTREANDGAVPGPYTVSVRLMNYNNPNPADLKAKWECDPATVEVGSSGTDSLAINVKRGK